MEDEATPPEVKSNVEDEIKSLLIEIHGLYVADLMNPFKEIGTPITSKRFEDKLQHCIAAYNQTERMMI